MSPRDIPAEQTARFLAAVLPPRARVLEVGCGDGRVAARLARRGFSVRGIDTDTAAVRAARARGVKASVADIRTYEDDPFDAIVFTRSLHHIHPLGEALRRAARLLRPGGLLVAEEYAHEAADRATALWFYAVAALLESAKVVDWKDLSSRNPDPLARWREDHSRERLSTGRQMRRAAAKEFSITRIDGTPYLYRHFCDRLPASRLGARLARMLFEQETRGVADGSLRPTGLRLVARKPGRRRRSSSKAPRARRAATAAPARKSPRSRARRRPRS